MIGTSTRDYIFIQICIYGLHYIAPLCILYCASLVLYYGPRPAISRIPLPLELWAIAETLFYIVVHLWYRRVLQNDAVHPPLPSREERRKLFDQCDATITDPEDYLRKWFLGAPITEIKRDNLKEFFLWGFFNRGGLPGDDNDELEEYITRTEKLLGRKIESGRGTAKCLRLTLDPANMLHRSIVWYWCVGFVDFLACVRLWFRGFHLHRTSLTRFFGLFPWRTPALLTMHRSQARHLTYWHRPSTGPSNNLPVVFIHGIGIGLYPYIPFLASIPANISILAIELMPVSFRITHAVLPAETLVAEITTILKHHNIHNFVLVAHSYGTAIATQLLHSRLSPQINSLVLIDPITILLHLPDVAVNFTRRTPRRANEHQLHYFAGMDMGVSHALSRGFFWSEVVLWSEDFEGKRVTASLAKRDLIVDTEKVGRYLAQGQVRENGDAVHANGNGHVAKINDWKSRPWRGQGLDIVWWEELDHAQVFDKVETRKVLVDAIVAYCKQD